MTKQTEQEINERYEEEGPWINLWDGLLQFGLVLFEPDGLIIDEKTDNTLGLECILGLRTYFENIESYRRAGRVHKFIQEYQKRWPDAPLGKGYGL